MSETRARERRMLKVHGPGGRGFVLVLTLGQPAETYTASSLSTCLQPYLVFVEQAVFHLDERHQGLGITERVARLVALEPCAPVMPRSEMESGDEQHPIFLCVSLC